jgi:hypothetical protein
MRQLNLAISLLRKIESSCNLHRVTLKAVFREWMRCCKERIISRVQSKEKESEDNGF